MFSKTHVLLRREFLPHLAALAPSEAKIYIAILIMACPKNGRLTIPLKDLANRSGLSYRITNHAVLRLKEMKHIRYSSDYAMKVSRIEIVNYLPVDSILTPRSAPESLEESNSQQNYENNDQSSHPTTFGRENLPDAPRKSPEVANARIPLQPKEKVIFAKDPGKALVPQTPADLIKNKLIETVDREFTGGQSLEMIRSLCATRSIPVIHKAYDSVRKIPPEKIKKSKLALFIYFLQHHAEDK